MLTKNVASQGVYLFAYTLSTALAKTGDAANITGAISKDGAASAATATANPTEIGAGIYWQPLSQGETNCNALSISWASSTSGVLIRPVTVLTDRGSVPADLQTIKTQTVTAGAGVTFPGTLASTTNITAAAGITLAAGGLSVRKNTALSAFTFPMFDSSDHITPKTGLSVVATRSLDGGAFASTVASATEIGTTGFYKIDLATTDLNANVVALKFAATGADPRIFTILTQA